MQGDESIKLSDLNIIYDTIQFLQNTNKQRSFMLNHLGDVYLKLYRTTSVWIASIKQSKSIAKQSETLFGTTLE